MEQNNNLKESTDLSQHNTNSLFFSSKSFKEHSTELVKNDPYSAAPELNCLEESNNVRHVKQLSSSNANTSIAPGFKDAKIINDDTTLLQNETVLNAPFLVRSIHTTLPYDKNVLHNTNSERSACQIISTDCISENTLHTITDDVNDISTNVSSDLLNKDDSRVRSMSDSWPIWGAVSPYFSASSWFEKSESFQSFANSSRHQVLTNTIASKETRRLVLQYDAAKSQSLQLHAQYKHCKWGEDEFCDFDLNTDELNIELPIADTIRIFPITDTLAQCVKSYSTLFSQLSQNRQNHCSSATIDSSNLLSKSLTNSTVIQDDHCFMENLNASSSLHNVSDTFSSKFVEVSSFGDLAVPRAVQEAFDFAISVSGSASRAIEALLPPACPRRRISHHDEPSQISSLGKDSTVYGCPRRFNRIVKHLDPDGPYRQFGDLTQTLGTCPRRAVESTGCPKRERRRRKKLIKKTNSKLNLLDQSTKLDRHKFLLYSSEIVKNDNTSLYNQACKT